jgi:hypothetical protein
MCPYKEVNSGAERTQGKQQSSQNGVKVSEIANLLVIVSRPNSRTTS